MSRRVVLTTRPPAHRSPTGDSLKVSNFELLYKIMKSTRTLRRTIWKRILAWTMLLSFLLPVLRPIACSLSAEMQHGSQAVSAWTLESDAAPSSQSCAGLMNCGLVSAARVTVVTPTLVMSPTYLIDLLVPVHHLPTIKLDPPEPPPRI